MVTLPRGKRAPIMIGAALSVVFGWAAIAKLASMSSLERALGDSGLVPSPVIHLAAILIIALELFAAVGLWTAASRPSAIWTAILLSWSYLCYAVWSAAWHVSAPCSCLGPLYHLAPWQRAILSGILLGLSLALLIAERKEAASQKDGAQNDTAGNNSGVRQRRRRLLAFLIPAIVILASAQVPIVQDVLSGVTTEHGIFIPADMVRFGGPGGVFVHRFWIANLTGQPLKVKIEPG